MNRKRFLIEDIFPEDINRFLGVMNLSSYSLTQSLLYGNREFLLEGKDFPNFEMLDERIASALNKIIQNSKVSLEEQKAQKEDRSFAENRSLT